MIKAFDEVFGDCVAPLILYVHLFTFRVVKFFLQALKHHGDALGGTGPQLFKHLIGMIPVCHCNRFDSNRSQDIVIECICILLIGRKGFYEVLNLLEDKYGIFRVLNFPICLKSLVLANEQTVLVYVLPHQFEGVILTPKGY